MYLLSQSLIFLALAMLIGGLIDYAFRACLADTACDDVRDDLALAENRYQALLDETNRAKADLAALAPIAAANDHQSPPAYIVPPRAPMEPFPVLPLVKLDPFPDQSATRQSVSELADAPDDVAQASLSALSPRALEAELLNAAPGASPRYRFDADDLTAIKGLTPKMDAFLSKMGITRLADIASLSPAELYWLVENLPDDGSSIYRDQWIAQATRLLAKT